MEIEQILDKIYPLPLASKQRLLNIIAENQFAKGTILLQAEKREKNIYFIKKGIVRAFAFADGNELTFWFGKEGETVLSMRSYVDDKKSYESVELLENGSLYALKTELLKELFLEDIHIANWGRKLAEKELVQTEERLISRQFKTATQRYKELLEQEPQLLQRVQLSYIASYLGITQVSLSRIRAEIK